MEIKETNGCFDVIDEELGCILSLRKDDKSITVWKSSVYAGQKNAIEQNKKEGKWLIIGHK